MKSKSRKATFSLHEDVLREVDQAVRAGHFESKNAFVESALRQAVDVVRRRELRRRWEEAARDPHFLADIAEVEADFAAADAETARRIV